MIQICFSHSTKGSLRYAQNCGRGLTGVAPIVVLGGAEMTEQEKQKAIAQAKREIQEREKSAIPLGGRPTDVICLSFGLSMGDIASGLESGAREKLLLDWLTANPWDELEQTAASAKQYWQGCMNDLAVLKQRAGAGEPVRIWCDHTPDSMCGLLSTADRLRKLDCRVTAVMLPTWRERSDGSIETYCGWGDVCPEEYGHFLSGEIELSKSALDAFSIDWLKLKEQNTPLRAVVSGRVVGVDDDFYDTFINREIPKGEFKLANLIGKVLANYQLGIGDWLIAKRIGTMIDSGALCIVQEDGQRYYNTVLCAK